MKKLLLGSMLVMTVAAANAQLALDTVAMGNSYATNKWYSLAEDEIDSASATNWEIAFAATSAMTSPLTTAIHINPKTVSLFEAENELPMDFAAITSFDNNWPQLLNTDTLWSYGAFNVPVTPSIGIDYGFGTYNTGTHVIEANRVFILRYGTQNFTYKKIMITLDPNNGANYYIVKHANLDNSETVVDTLDIAAHDGKNFFYYRATDSTVLDREPSNENWDLLFTQYTDNTMAYTVTGVLHNLGVEAAKAINVADVNTYNDFLAEDFSPYINTIGYDWKTLNQQMSGYDIADSTVYFVKALNGDIWKIVFTGFQGSMAGGQFQFGKEMITTASVNNANGKNEASLAIYPNPASGGNVNVIYNLNNNATAKLMVTDITGRVVIANQLNGNKGLHQHIINTQNLAAGTYIINVMTDAGAMQQKLIVQ
jgi:hypothetical protein